MTTYHQQHDGEYKPVFLKNTTIDICKHSGGQFSKIFVAVFLPDMIEKSNMNRPCPFSVKKSLIWGHIKFLLTKLFVPRFVHIQGAIYMRNFQFQRSLKLPRIVPGKWILDFEFYVPGFEGISFRVKVFLEVRPIGWHLFEFELN